MSTFAVQCQRMKDQNGHQYGFQDGTVKNAVDELMLKYMPAADEVLDTTGLVPGGDKFMSSTWLYGFSTDMQFIGLPPNGAGQIRVHAVGSVDCLIINLPSLVKMLESLPDTKKSMTRTDVRAELQACDSARLQGLQASGVQMWQHCLEKGQILYLPTGVALVEKCKAGQEFIYGLRKSFLGLNAHEVTAYKTVLDLFSQDIMTAIYATA